MKIKEKIFWLQTGISLLIGIAVFLHFAAKLPLFKNNGEVFAVSYDNVDFDCKTIIFSHPRIFITDGNKDKLHDKVEWLLADAYKRIAGGSKKPLRLASLKEHIYHCGYLYQMTGDMEWADRVIEAMEQFPASINAYGGENNGYAYALEGLAIGYDWCYEAISKEKKDYYLSLIKEYYVGNKDNLKDNQDFHNYASQAEFAMLVAGLATFGDNPQACDWIREARMIVEWGQKDFPYYKVIDSIQAVEGTCNWEGATYGRQQLFSYIKYAEALRTATADKINLWQNIFSTLENAGYYIIYSLRPDNKFENLSDTSYPGVSYFDINNMAGLHSVFRNKYFTSFINKYYRWRSGKFATDVWLGRNNSSLIFYLLWYDPDIPSADLSELPKARRFGDVIIMRQGFDEGDTFVSFKSGTHWGFHSQLDHGSFTIYKRAPLAIDSGYYDSWGKEGMPHNWNYWKRTIAHNSILVIDPNERMPVFPKNNILYDDGGQRFAFVTQNPPNRYSGSHNKPRSIKDLEDRIDEFKMGEITAFDATDDYTYVKTDLTNAYNNIYSGKGTNQSRKVSFAQREFIYVYPDIVIVFDRVAALDARFKKIWLLHSGNYYTKEGRPDFNGTIKIIKGETFAGIAESSDTDTVTIENGQGRLLVKTLLPQKHITRRIGGRDYEFWTGGKNFPVSVDEIPAERKHEDPGAWRVEIEPAAAQREDFFLNVLYPYSSSEPKTPAITTIDSGNVIGARVDTKDESFSEVIAAFLKQTGGSSIEFSTVGEGICRVLICGVKSGQNYNVFKDKKPLFKTTADDQGVLYFEVDIKGEARITIREQ